MEKRLFTALEQLGEIEGTYPTLFYFYNEKGIRENTTKLKQAFSWSKGCKEYFAVEAAPGPFLLNILKGMGCGADCSSMTEFMMSKACGFTGYDIIFSSNDTPPEEFAYTQKMGAIVNLDDITYVECLGQTLGYVPETISCRYNLSGIFKVSNDIMGNPEDSKYGTIRDQILQAFKTLKTKGAKRSGIHAFLASNMVTNECYLILAKIPPELTVDLKEEMEAHISFTNLPGGIGISYRPNQEPNSILAIGDGMREVYEEILIQAGMDDVVVCMELGRPMMGPYGTLVAKAIHEGHIHEEHVGADACTVSLMRPAMYGAYHHTTVMGKEEAPCNHVYDVVGSLYENDDKFVVDRSLPEIERDDLLSIHGAGVHGFAMGYNCNGKLKLTESLLKEDSSIEMIRRTEAPGDYFVTLDFYDTLECADRWINT